MKQEYNESLKNSRQHKDFLSNHLDSGEAASPSRLPVQHEVLSGASVASLLALDSTCAHLSFQGKGADAKGSGPLCPAASVPRSRSSLRKLVMAPFKNQEIKSRDDLYEIKDQFQAALFSRKKKTTRKYEPLKPFFSYQCCPNFHGAKLVTVCSCNNWVICPFCRKKRNKRNQARIANYMLAMQRDLKPYESLKFLTLTMKKGEMSFGKAREKILKDFKRLRRTKAWKKKISYFIATFEVVEGNVHLHISLSGRFWEQAEISDAWFKITGDSMIVDIRKIDSIEKATQELCKYMAKDSEPSVVNELADYREANKNRRYMISGRRPPSLDTIATSGQPKCEQCHHPIGLHGQFRTESEANAFLLSQVKAREHSKD